MSRKRYSRKIKSAAGITTVFLLAAGASCAPKLALSPPSLVKALSERGWTYSDPPRGILSAGSIVSVSADRGVQYRSRLATCISDPQITTPRIAPIALSGTLSGSTSFGIDLLASYEAISVGPEFSKIKNFSITLKSATEEALDSIAIRDWIDAHKGAFSAACADALLGKPGENPPSQGGYFVLTDVLRVTGYKYTFHDETGAQVKLTLPNLSKYFSINGNANYKTNSDGDLEVDNGDLYIAFQQDVSTKIGVAGLAPGSSAVDIMKLHNQAIK
jgi:hypothetical protein